MDRYAVIGHPVAHSLSPRIHTCFAEQTGADLHYDRIDPGADGFRAAVTDFLASGGLGLNVTLPFKGEAAAFADRLAPTAQGANVVNTLAVVDGVIEGHNTDGTGLVRDLTANLGLSLQGTRILILGAGGAARGVLGSLLAENPVEVVIGNRTPGRAQELAEDFSTAGSVAGGGWHDVAQSGCFDIIINATAASLDGALPPIDGESLCSEGTVYDMMYGPAARAFLDWGRHAGASRCVDGLGMLVEQAAESFRIWRGVHPETAALLAALSSPGAGRDA